VYYIDGKANRRLFNFWRGQTNIGVWGMKDILKLEENKKLTLFDLIDTYIRDAQARKAYAS